MTRIDLFDHRLRQELDFSSDFDCGDVAARHKESLLREGRRCRHAFAKCAIAPTSPYPLARITEVYNPLATFNSLGEGLRLVEGQKVFIQVDGDLVAQA